MVSFTPIVWQYASSELSLSSLISEFREFRWRILSRDQKVAKFKTGNDSTARQGPKQCLFEKRTTLSVVKTKYRQQGPKNPVRRPSDTLINLIRPHKSWGRKPDSLELLFLVWCLIWKNRTPNLMWGFWSMFLLTVDLNPSKTKAIKS